VAKAPGPSRCSPTAPYRDVGVGGGGLRVFAGLGIGKQRGGGRMTGGCWYLLWSQINPQAHGIPLYQFARE
jgi:hypothetical protein